MKIFVAGATGAVGRQLIPLLSRTGHIVTGMTHHAAKAPAIEAMGARAAVADGLKRDAVIHAVSEAKPDVIIHEMTALSAFADFRNFAKEFAQTNRLRIDGTRHLLEAAHASGVRRFVAQSYCGWTYARGGGPVKTEDDPLDHRPPAQLRSTLEAIRSLEREVAMASDIAGLVLRYGSFYGPGTSLAPGGAHLEAVRKRKFPIVGGGGGVWSFVHIKDVATATALAAERGEPGIYNIVDDDPAPVFKWLPYLASVVGAKPPHRVPRWIGKLFVGEAGVMMMTEIRGASNAKAKEAFGWKLTYPSWHEGFRLGLAEREASR